MTLTVLPLVDLRENFDHDKEILGTILDMFMLEVPQDCSLLEQHIENGDYKEARLQAHKIKSSYRTLGINDMANILQEIENCVKNEIETIPSLLAQFNKHYQQVNAQVNYTKEKL
jgi:HPt (histidine-containing phosphotransfer) domain-containing protein